MVKKNHLLDLACLDPWNLCTFSPYHLSWNWHNVCYPL